MPAAIPATKRWEEEARFFDAVAKRTGSEVAPLAPAVVQRYSGAARSLYLKEFLFQLIGPLRGKRILDVGCGDGENAVLLARLGAKVTGVDVSPKAIEVARQRAAVNDVGERTDFVCAPLETADLPAATCDVIWVDNVLHHVIPTLDETLERLCGWARPGALLLFAEPTNLNPALRKVRFLVPVHTEVTPGERPLERKELEIVRAHLSDLQMRHFNFLGRLNRFVLPCLQYENAPRSRRLAADALAAIDQLVLGVRGLESLGGMGVLYGHAPGRPASGLQYPREDARELVGRERLLQHRVEVRPPGALADGHRSVPADQDELRL